LIITETDPDNGLPNLLKPELKKDHSKYSKASIISRQTPSKPAFRIFCV